VKGLMTAAASVRTVALEELQGLGMKALEDDAADHGAFEVVLSTPDKDREGEEVKAAEWELPLPDHITFDNDHGMSVASTIGSGVPTIEDGNLIVRGTFASTPLAQDTRTLVAEKHIRTTSVTFRRKSVVVDGARVVRRELLNGAFVAVPANPKAVVLSSKSLAAGVEDDEPEDGAVVKAMASAVRKALLGSFEERQQAVQHALDRLYRRTSTYGYLVGTTETTAVWRTWSYADDDSDRAEWRADYSIDSNGTATLETPQRVRVVEVVTEALEETETQPAATTARSTSADATKDAADQAEQVSGSHAPGPGSEAEQVEMEQAKALLSARSSELAALLVT